MSETVTKKMHFTYHIIACVMRKHPYKADDKTKALALAVKDYLLEVLNSQNKGGKIYDPVIVSQAFHFYNHQLAWGTGRWERSSEIVYRYFKAKILIEKIKEYDKVAGKPIVNDYRKLLDYLYESLGRNEEINYSGAPGITEDFVYVPTVILDEIIIKFQKLYE